LVVSVVVVFPQRREISFAFSKKERAILPKGAVSL